MEAAYSSPAPVNVRQCQWRSYDMGVADAPVTRQYYIYGKQAPIFISPAILTRTSSTHELVVNWCEDGEFDQRLTITGSSRPSAQLTSCRQSIYFLSSSLLPRQP